MKYILLTFAGLLVSMMAQAQHYVDGTGPCGGNTPCYPTIQQAVNAAASGETISVYPGTYNEMVIIQKPLLLQSTGGRDVTILQYTLPGGYIAPIMIQADNGSYSGVTIGGAVNKGFTIIGADVTNDVAGGAVESAAIIIGSNAANSISNINISHNKINPNGDVGILTYYKGTNLYNNVTVQYNLFEGKTYVGQPQAGGYFAHGNVPRFLISINPGTSNFVFANNRVTTTTGEVVGGINIGRGIIYAEPATATFTENYFAPSFANGYTGTAPNTSSMIRIGGSNASFSCNYFSMAAANDAPEYIRSTLSFPTPPPYNVAATRSNNTFVDPGAVSNFFGYIVKTPAAGTAANSANPAPGCSIVLPVNFGPVYATVSGNNLQVTWTTLHESGNNHFEIEASKDGKAFSVIGTVASFSADGDSTANLQYTFTRALHELQVLGISLFGLFAFSLLGHRKNKSLLLIAVLLVVVIINSCSSRQDSIDSYTGKLYIRVAQVDKNGNKDYSKVITAVVNDSK